MSHNIEDAKYTTMPDPTNLIGEALTIMALELSSRVVFIRDDNDPRILGKHADIGVILLDISENKYYKKIGNDDKDWIFTKDYIDSRIYALGKNTGSIDNRLDIVDLAQKEYNFYVPPYTTDIIIEPNATDITTLNIVLNKPEENQNKITIKNVGSATNVIIKSKDFILNDDGSVTDDPLSNTYKVELLDDYSLPSNNSIHIIPCDGFYVT